MNIIDFLFRKDERDIKVVRAKYQGLIRIINATNAMSLYDQMKLRRLSEKLAVMTVKENYKIEQDRWEKIGHELVKNLVVKPAGENEADLEFKPNSTWKHKDKK